MNLLFSLKTERALESTLGISEAEAPLSKAMALVKALFRGPKYLIQRPCQSVKEVLVEVLLPFICLLNIPIFKSSLTSGVPLETSIVDVSISITGCVLVMLGCNL